MIWVGREVGGTRVGEGKEYDFIMFLLYEKIIFLKTYKSTKKK